MLERLLARFFPPRLPKIYIDIETADFEEQGWAGNIRPRQYRDGIDRYFKTERDNVSVSETGTSNSDQ